MDDNFYCHSLYKNWLKTVLIHQMLRLHLMVRWPIPQIYCRSLLSNFPSTNPVCVWKSAPPPQSSTLCRQFPTIQSPASLSPTEVSQIEQLTAGACFGKAAYLSSSSSSFNMQRCSSPALGAVRGSAGRRLVLLSADIRGGGGRLPSQWTLWRATQETATRPQHAE